MTRQDREERESLMQRRLRAARGEEYDEPYDDDDDDDEPEYAPRVRSYVVPAGGGCGQSLVVSAAALLVVGLVALLVAPQLASRLTSGLGGSIGEGVGERIREVVATPTPTVRDRGGTITQIQALNRIETIRFSVERVVEAGTERGDWLDTLLGERLLLIASGDVVAGVDLSRLRASDVLISPDGDSITINLPPSEIFSASLNNDRTRVYDRDTRLVTQLTGGADPTLETQARQAAEDEILRAACEGDVMARAANEAKRSMEQFLGLLEFTSITVNVQPGQCVAPSSADQSP